MSELLADAGLPEPNPFQPLLDVLETGRWPVGLYDNAFYAA